MVQSPSWEANWFAASQEIPRISRNPKVHYCTHKRPPPVSILGLPNPVHMPISHLLQIRPNIIQPSTPRSPHSLLPSGFPTKTPYTPSSHINDATWASNCFVGSSKSDWIRRGGEKRECSTHGEYHIYIYTYRVSQEECARLREGVPYVKVYRYNPKHLCPKLNGYGDNGQRSLKLWQLLRTYWLPNTY